MTWSPIRLDARSPARRCHRACEIAVNAALFGAWAVELNYGRIGTFGRATTRSFRPSMKRWR